MIGSRAAEFGLRTITRAKLHPHPVPCGQGRFASVGIVIIPPQAKSSFSYQKEYPTMFPLNCLALLIQRARGNEKKQPITRKQAALRRRLEVEYLEGREMPTAALIAAPTFSGPASSTTDTTPTFSWANTAGAAQYDFWVDNVTTGQAQVIRNQALMTNAFTPATPLPASSYQAWIRVTTAAGTSPWSAAYNITITPPAIPTLTAPTGSLAGMTPTFTWTASADATHYDLWVTNLTPGQSQIVRRQNLTTTSYTPAGLLPMGSYVAWV